jgi:hypothetical protein
MRNDSWFRGTVAGEALCPAATARLGGPDGRGNPVRGVALSGKIPGRSSILMMTPVPNNRKISHGETIRCLT